jgi:hypothetical protein
VFWRTWDGSIVSPIQDQYIFALEDFGGNPFLGGISEIRGSITYELP